MGLLLATRAMARAATPLVPDGDEARRWAEQELSDPVYTIAQPTLLDRVAQAVGQFFQSLFEGDVDGSWGATAAVIIAVVIVIVIVAALLVWGIPRSDRRAPSESPALLFGDTDSRSAAQLRNDAAARAKVGDWDGAVVLRFRALARSCLERGAVETTPGATVHAFARAAARSFPAHADDLETAAAAFDDVRYLRRPGTADVYERVSAVDDAVTRTRPAVSEAMIP